MEDANNSFANAYSGERLSTICIMIHCFSARLGKGPVLEPAAGLYNQGDYTYAWMVAAGTRMQEAATEDSYPNEMMQIELSVQLGLSDRQLQMWFCHCRLKDRKNLLAKIAQLAQGLHMCY